MRPTQTPSWCEERADSVLAAELGPASWRLLVGGSPLAFVQMILGGGKPLAMQSMEADEERTMLVSVGSMDHFGATLVGSGRFE